MILNKASCLPQLLPLGRVSSRRQLALTQRANFNYPKSSLSAACPYPSPNCLNSHAEKCSGRGVGVSKKVSHYSNVSAVMSIIIKYQWPNILTNLQRFAFIYMRTHAGAGAKVSVFVCKNVRLLINKTYYLTKALHSVRSLKTNSFAISPAKRGIFGGVYG